MIKDKSIVDQVTDALLDKKEYGASVQLRREDFKNNRYDEKQVQHDLVVKLTDAIPFEILQRIFNFYKVDDITGEYIEIGVTIKI